MRPTRCEICNGGYDADDRSAVRAHRKRCANWTEACAELGYTPAHRAEREAMKSRADRSLEGVELRMRAWFDRSLESAILEGYWRDHPDFETFAGMVSVPHMDTETIRDRFPRQEGHIPENRTYWLPEARRGRV